MINLTLIMFWFHRAWTHDFSNRDSNPWPLACRAKMIPLYSLTQECKSIKHSLQSSLFYLDQCDNTHSQEPGILNERHHRLLPNHSSGKPTPLATAHNITSPWPQLSMHTSHFWHQCCDSTESQNPWPLAQGLKPMTSRMWGKGDTTTQKDLTWKCRSINFTTLMHCNWPTDHALDHSSIGLNRLTIQLVFNEVWKSLFVDHQPIQTFKFFLNEFCRIYRIYRISRKLILVILKVIEYYFQYFRKCKVLKIVFY